MSKKLATPDPNQATEGQVLTVKKTEPLKTSWETPTGGGGGGALQHMGWN